MVEYYAGWPTKAAGESFPVSADALSIVVHEPIGVVAAIIWLPKFAQAQTRRFDFAGFATIATALVSLLLAFSEGPSWGWTGYRVLGLIALGLLSLAAFIVVELEVEYPLLNLRVFRNRLYSTSLIAMSVMMTGLFATLFYIPLFLQQAQ